MALLEVLDDMAPMNDKLKEIAEPRRGRVQDERWWSRTSCEINCLNKTSVPILLSAQGLAHMGVILDFSTGACLLSISVQLEEEANGQRQNSEEIGLNAGSINLW